MHLMGKANFNSNNILNQSP